MKNRYTVSALILAMGLTVAMPSIAGPEDHAEGDKPTSSSKSRKVRRDEAVTEKTEDLGQKLFFGGLNDLNLGSFKERYERVQFSEKKNLVDAINDIKPWREGDELPTVEQEMPIAEAIADMFDTMTEKDAPKVVELIAAANDKVKKKPSSDSQYDEFVKRLWDAAQLKVPTELWPEKVKRDGKGEKDERLASFREAFKEARDKALEVAAKKNQLIKDAPTNAEARAKLFGDKEDKDNFEKNKYAVGKDVGAYIQNQFAAGNKTAAMDMAKAISYKDGDKWKMHLNNADGKPVTMELPAFKPENAEQIAKIFNDEKMKSSKFVGWEHDKSASPVAWAWDPKTKSVAKKEAPQQNSFGATVGGAIGAAAAGAAGAAVGQAAGAAVDALASVSSLIPNKCQSCHKTEIQNGQIVNLLTKKTGSANTNWDKMGQITSTEKDALQKFVGGNS